MNHTIHLTGQNQCRTVKSGQVELFAYDASLPEGARRLHHLRTLGEGASFEDIAPQEANGITWACIARTARNTKLRRANEAPDGAYAQADYQAQIEQLAARIDDERRKMDHRRQMVDQRMNAAIENLTNVNSRLVQFGGHFDEADELLSACEAIGSYLGVEIKSPTADVADRALSPVEHILHLSRIRYREVTLTDRWWRRNSGPMIGRMRDGAYVTMLPRGLNGYSIFNARTGQTQRLTEQIASQMEGEAHAVYRTFPQRKLNARAIAKFVLGSHIYVELAVIALFSLLASIIQVLPPILSAQIFNEIVPGHMRGMLFEVILILIAFQIAQIGFNVVTNIGFSRVKTKVDLALQAAVWDRLLAQKLQFFYQYATGELLEKVRGLNAINNTLSLDLLKTAMTTLFSAVNLIVMYRYSPMVTRALLWPFVGFLGAMLLLSYRKYRLGRRYIRVLNESSAYNHQMLSGIQRIKTSFAEDRAFAQWSEREAERRDVEGQMKLTTTASAALKTFFQLASMAYVYLLLSREPGLDSGMFVAYTGTFLIFLSAMLRFSGIVDQIMELAPVVRNVQPLMAAVPDDPSLRTTPKDIDGTIELNHVTFNYQQYGRTILHDISLRIERGESVGIVGRSGCGKTTLMKLMLGLYEPTGGKIFFGGYDMSAVDTQFLRRQLGVVTQNGTLSFGSIFSNIAQSDPSITEQDVIKALQTVALYDDIQALPHGIYTSLDSEKASLSDGQIQRLLIARTIVKPRAYLFFDEASSKLDNVLTQQIMRLLSDVKCTKVIVAQRLATIELCDRIIVMDDGRVIAEGTYDEIINQRHLFGVVFDTDDDDPLPAETA